MSLPLLRRSRLVPGLALVVAAATLTAAGPTGAAGTSERVGSASAASAAPQANLHRISGNPDGQAGLEVWQGLCSVPGAVGNFEPFKFGYGNGQPFPYGPLSVAWTPQSADAAIALRASTKNPRNVDLFDVQVFHPEPSVEGFVSVSYVPDSNVDEEWLGKATFTDSKRGWHPVYGTKVIFKWTHLVAGTTRDGQTTPDSTLRALAERLGTKRDSASMGFAFGCDGKQSFVDGLRLGDTAKGWDVFDMVGRPSSVSLNLSRKAKSCRLSAPRYPGILEFSGRLKGLEAAAIWRLDGRGRLVRRISRTEPAVNGRFAGRLRVERSAAVVAYARNTGTTAGAVSKALRVTAEPEVNFDSRRRSTVQGRGLSIAGTLEAAGRVRYTALYTHWTGSSWTPYRAVDKGRTQRGGRFVVKAPASALGFSRISILTKPNKKMSGSLSRTAVTYRVDRRPRPAPQSFGGSGQAESTSSPPLAPAPTPQQPSGSGGENEPAPTPEPGRVVAKKPGSGYGACGWKPPTRRP